MRARIRPCISINNRAGWPSICCHSHSQSHVELTTGLVIWPASSDVLDVAIKFVGLTSPTRAAVTPWSCRLERITSTKLASAPQMQSTETKYLNDVLFWVVRSLPK